MGFSIKNIPVVDLALDALNPRLPSYVRRDQTSMLTFLAKSSSIEELMSAISENGFFSAESLIAVPEKDQLVVVEGNRRLTALKLLLGETYEGISPRILDLQRTARYKPDTVPVAIYDDRSEVLNYLGNRHIAGVKPWGALAKARYVKQLFEQTSPSESFSDRARTVAKVIGSRRDFISKSLRAYELYEHALEKEFYGLDIDESDIRFSIISTAIDYEGVQKFLYQLEEDLSDLGDRTPDDERVKEFFSWLFLKDKEGRVRLGESRNLNKLSRIMLSEEALRSFRSGATIDQAYLYTTGINDDFDLICHEIQRSLREANSLVADVEKTPERESLASSILRQARQLDISFRE